MVESPISAPRHVGGLARIYEGETEPTPAQMLTLFAEDTKQSLRKKAKACRAALLSAGFLFRSKVIQTRNVVDITNINSAAITAASDPYYTAHWIVADNSFLDLDSTGVIAMQKTMTDRSTAIYAAYTTLTTQIDAAITPEQLSAINPQFSVA